VADPQYGRGKKRAAVKKELSMNYIEHCKLPGMYDLSKEKAEMKISKHALLEALFGTQVWASDYIKNPFIYVTDNVQDFQGEEGQKLEQYFKRVFFDQWQKYNNAILSATH